MINNPQVGNFINELINRIRTRSPKFFLVCQIIGLCMIGMGYVPAMLERWTTVVVSQQFINFCEDVSLGAIGFTSGMFLAGDTRNKGLTYSGDIVQKMDAEKFPFTAEVERKKADELPIVPDPLPKSK
jgi:hypothetical protein